MAERKKIIIQTGTEPDKPLSTPHFDAEATLTARPVVPLTEQETYQAPYGDYGVRAAKPFWKRPALIALIVLVAVGAGVAAGIAIGINRNRKSPETSAATTTTTAPPSEVANAGQTVEPTAQQPEPQTRAAIPEETADEPTAEPVEEVRERTARNEPKRTDDEIATPPIVRDRPIIRDKRRDRTEADDDDDIAREREARQAEKERRRDERREDRRDERRERRRRQRGDEIEFPREVQRAGREKLDRIREIFEGRQP